MKNTLLFAVLAGVLGLAACSQDENDEAVLVEGDSSLEASASGPNVRLYTFDCGRIDISDLGIFSINGEYAGREHSVAASCFLIRHPDGDLMWDAGLPDAIHEQAEGVTDGVFHLTVPTTLASQLEALGVAPDDIDYFSLSHSHFDHAGNAAMFADSTFLVDSDERAHMFRDEVRNNPQEFGLIAALESAETQEFDGDHDVFGDGSVVILDMPGHTPGHTSLLLNLRNAGPVLLSGDLYHLIESREKRIVPGFNTNAEDTLASMDRFEAIAAEENARVIIQHSQEHIDELPKPPAYLD